MKTMICWKSPANDNYEETLFPLRDIDQTKKLRTSQSLMKVVLSLEWNRRLGVWNQKVKQKFSRFDFDIQSSIIFWTEINNLEHNKYVLMKWLTDN